jgi:hypothetical protein
LLHLRRTKITPALSPATPATTIPAAPTTAIRLRHNLIGSQTHHGGDSRHH